MQSPNSQTAPYAKVAFSVDEFCAAHSISRGTFYVEVAAKRIHVLKVGRRTIVPAAESAAWLKRLGSAKAA